MTTFGPTDDRRDAVVPPLGLGTMGLETPADAAAITRALELGYRHVDTAQIYGNETLVGDAIAAADVPRDDVLVATKVWADSLAYDDVVETTRESLDRLGFDTIDLLYVHRPIDTYDPEATLSAFDFLCDVGDVSHVGVSNFTVADLEVARDHLDAPIVAHQTEYHPLFQRPELLDDARDHGYTPVAYSPLAGGGVFDLPELSAIADRHGVTEAQVSLAWLRAHELTCIPKASSRDHLAANQAAMDLTLTADEVATIDAIDREEELFPE